MLRLARFQPRRQVDCALAIVVVSRKLLRNKHRDPLVV